MTESRSQQEPSPISPLTVPKLQERIREMFGHKDTQRGVEGTFMWFLEEVGELSGALRARDQESAKREDLEGEFADVLAWLVTLANMTGVDLQQAIEQKYCKGCPRCGEDVCRCQMSQKP